MTSKKTAKVNLKYNGNNVVELRDKINEAINEYKAEHPDIDVDAILAEHEGTLPLLGSLQHRELDKFITYAKQQGTKMPFDAMEMGVLAAGRKDMRNGLSELLNSLKFDKAKCSECDEEMDDRGRSKKKVITSVGKIEIRPARLVCVLDTGQSYYPLLDFMNLIDREVVLPNGTRDGQTIKCTRNAAASIAMVCSENSYNQAILTLKRLLGLDLTDMTELRITNSVGAELVNDAPVEIAPGKVEEITNKLSDNILKTRLDLLNDSHDKDKIIQKALTDGPEGVLRKNYIGSTIKVMYILCDGTGVPGRRQELAGVKGKQPDGSAKTFEAKIGVVFVVEYTADGKPLLTESGDIYRNKEVRYVGTVRAVNDFGPMLYQHAVNNGLEDMDAVVFIGDGAKWVWGIRDTYFPFALTCLDLYHSIERVNDMVDFIQFKGQSIADRKQAFKGKCLEHLRSGKIQDMIAFVENAQCKKGAEKKLGSSLNYFRTNMDHMNYGTYTAAGLFVGSGVIEAGCKVIVGDRMKNAGMHWTRDSAENMIAIRCATRNNDFLDIYLNDRTLSAKRAA